MREPIGVRYYKITNSEKYLIWQTEILKRIYSDFNIQMIGGKEYPIVIFEMEKKDGNVETVSGGYDLMTDIEHYDINKTICRNFSQIVEPNMRDKKELSYMLHSFNINEKNKVDYFSTKVSSYEQIMYTSNILEYELYKLYRETRGVVPDWSRSEILQHLPLRNALHLNHSQFFVVTHGEGRNAGISVQVCYMVFDKNCMDYMIPYALLPDNIASKKGRLQFLPEGGYRLHNKTIADNERIFKNYRMNIACRRILLEQIYGHAEISAKDKLIINPNENIIIGKIDDLRRRREAYFDSLGVTIDLVTLRPTISFILRVDAPDFGYDKYKSNNDSINVRKVQMEDLDRFMSANRLTNESAGMYALLKKHKYYQNIQRKTG